MRTLYGKLWRQNCLIIAGVVAVIILIINIFAGYWFNVYKLKQLDNSYDDIYDIVSAQLISGDTWVLEETGRDILDNSGIIITLTDGSGNLIYDSTITVSRDTSHGWMMRMHGEMSRPEVREIINRYHEKRYEIVKSGKVIGRLTLSSVEEYDSNDLEYTSGITKIIVLIGVAAVICAVIISGFSAKSISKPISDVTDIAYAISKGDFDKGVEVKSKIAEVRNLALAIGNLNHNLKNNEKLRRRLTQDVAHELRTPIATIQGNLEAVLDDVLEMNPEMIKSCYEEILRLARMVENLNNLSKYENTVLNKSMFRLDELGREIIRNFERLVIEKDIGLDVQLPEVSIYADKDKISQIFINILSNAIKYSEVGGKVSVTLTKVNDKIILSVSDNGIGISDEDLPYIFERFYRADKSRSRSTGGAGIGLSIVKAIVDAHGGSVRAKSQKGIGTEVIVELIPD